MAHSLSLAAYMAWARRGPRSNYSPTQARPEGELVWGHADTLDHANALIQLAARLAALRPGLTMLLTSAAEVPDTGEVAKHVIRHSLPEDSVPMAEAFLAYWTPDICLWTGGELHPALLTCADRNAIPLYLIDADESALSRTSWRWFPDLPRALLDRFAMIMTRDDATARGLRRLGVRETQITVTGVFQEGTISLPYDGTERQRLADLLGSRPVWLAAMAHASELDCILAAHRKISRISHRVFLILVPDNQADGPAFARALERDGLRYATWSKAEQPEETTQVLLADTHGDMGLWYRLATISLMGNSLTPGLTGRDPNEPAAHGSAILYGPNVRRHMTSYKRFAEAGAARIVRDTDTLAAALQRLIAPDQSAAMAHAAWDVASVGARVTDQILDLVQDTLDVLEAG